MYPVAKGGYIVILILKNSALKQAHGFYCIIISCVKFLLAILSNSKPYTLAMAYLTQVGLEFIPADFDETELEEEEEEKEKKFKHSADYITGRHILVDYLYRRNVNSITTSEHPVNSKL